MNVMRHKIRKIVEEEAGTVGTAPVGATSGGTAADLGKVPTPASGLIQAQWFSKKKKKAPKGLRTLLSSLTSLPNENKN